MFRINTNAPALLRYFLGAFALTTLLGCDARIESFEFLDRRSGEVRSLELRDPGRLPPEEEATVAEEPLLLEFLEPLSIEPGEAGFYIRYDGGSGAAVRLIYGEEGEEHLSLPEFVGMTTPRRFYASVPAGELTGLRLESGGEPLVVRELGLSPYTPGVAVGPDGVQVSRGYDLRRLGSNLFLSSPEVEGEGNSLEVVEFSLEQDWEVEEPAQRPIVHLALTGGLPEESGGGEGAVMSAGGEQDLVAPATHRLEVLPGRREYHLHLHDWSGPVVLGLAGRGETALRSFRLRELAPQEPVPADMAQILTYPRRQWRQEGYELFRWSAYPRILLFDTEDYRYQARMFRRLAFFVEKAGFRGTLLTNAELANRHGWNAHNYRPEGLADFYNAVAESSFPLNEEELILREIVLREGVLLQDSETGTYEPGVGGVLSVSQESWSLLRELLITHEALHGVYYEEPDFRLGVEAMWDNQLSDDEREFWRFFLRFMTYDPDDTYLMQNEMQAYLLQFPLAEISGYFNGRIANRLRAGVPHRSSYIDQFFASRGGSFSVYAAQLNDLLFQLTGFLGGDFLALHQLD